MEKKFKNSLVFGKFYPPHKGHLYLMDTAIEQSEFTNILVCSLESETIDGYLRYTWIRDIYANYPNIRVIHCNDDLPQYPEEHPDFWAIWYDVVYSRIDNLDVLFTSEDYGKPFSKVLGIQHVLVDKERTTIPVSGTAIRNNPIENWEYIPDRVKPYFIKKIVIMGAESTGKTTLVKRLAEHYNTIYVEEFGRTYTENLDSIYDLSRNEFDHIAIQHSVSIDDSVKHANKFIFVDTEAITTKKFAKVYTGEDFESESMEYIINEFPFDLTILLNNDVPYVNDGLRLPEDVRDGFTEYYKNELEKYGIPYHFIGGTFDERFNQVVNIIDSTF